MSDRKVHSHLESALDVLNTCVVPQLKLEIDTLKHHMRPHTATNRNDLRNIAKHIDVAAKQVDKALENLT